MHDLTNMFRTIALAGAVLFTASSYAKPNEQPRFTGNDMLKACTEMDPTSEPMKRLPNAEEARDHGLCLGMVYGLSVLGGVATRNSPMAICNPLNATIGQWVSVIVRYLRRHPEEMHLDFMILGAKAASEAWPCTK